MILRFWPADPYAVVAVFCGAVTWRFARDLLRDGLHGMAGQGDVRLWPHRLGDTLRLRLSSPEGTSTMDMPRRPVGRFVERMYRLVPVGAESRHVDVDAWIAKAFAA